MWSHYGDFLKDENASSAYLDWNDLMHPLPGFALDAGSAVGRLTFELSRKTDFAIGIDTSHSFIRAARELMLTPGKGDPIVAGRPGDPNGNGNTAKGLEESKHGISGG